MSTERKAPDVLIVQDNLSGTVADIQDDPDSPDGAWLTAISNNANSIARVSFPTPTGSPTVGAGLQEFRALVRKMGGTGTPTARIELYENGVLIRAGSDIDITTDMVLSFTWNADELGTPDGSLVECRIYGTKVGGAPSKRATIEVGAIEWNVDYTAVQEFVYGGDIPVAILPDDPTAKLSKSYTGNILLSALPSYTSIGTMVYAGAVPLIALPTAPIAPLEKSFAGTMDLVLVPNSAYELAEGVSEYIYAGDVPLAILPAYISILEGIYSGDLPMVALPGYSSIMERIYAAAVTMSVLPSYSSTFERVYEGDIPAIILPNFPAAILEKSYIGDIAFVTLPDFPMALLSKSYGGDIDLVLTPNSIYELISGANEFVYAGNIPLAILPSYSSELDRIYQGALPLSILPDLPKGLIEKAYAGEIALALAVSSLTSLERVIIEYLYAGNIQIVWIPRTHNGSLYRVYGGNIDLIPIPASLYSGVRAAPDSYPPAIPRPEKEELLLIGEKEPVFILPKDRR